MEEFTLHPPEAASREATQFSASNRTNGENLNGEEEISLDAESKSSVFARRFSDSSFISLSEFLRARHVYIIGRTGVGKSTMLERIVINDINARKGTLFIDPHGTSALRVLDSIKRTRRICVFNMADRHYPVGFNPLAGIAPEHASKASTDLIDAIKDIFFGRDFNAPRFTHYLWNHLVPLIERGDCTLVDLLRMLSDKHYREKVTDNVQDPVSRLFWTKEFPSHDKKYNAEAVAPISNKLGQILASPAVRNVLNQVRPKLDLREALNLGYAVVVNLDKGRIGNDPAAFLGSLLISHANNILMARDDDECTAVSIAADEFQNFAIDIYASMFSEIRKKGGQLTVAHQFATQLDEHIFDSIMGNAGTIVSFQVSPKDAKLLAPQFDVNPQRPFSPGVLTQLDPFEAYVRTSDLEHVQTLEPSPPTGRAARIIEESRKRFARKV